MNLLYNIAIYLYSAAVKLVSIKNRKARKMINGHNKTFAIIRENITSDDRPIWIHASSLGEFEQGRPLIETIKRECPDQKILLTFFSPSGYEVRKGYDGVDVVCYLPFDTPANARRFVNAVNPKLAIFIKYEFWGNYLHQLKLAAVPTYIVSAIFRSTQVFFKPYGGMFREMLKNYDAIYLQDKESEILLQGIGVHNVEVLGDTRFDRVNEILSTARDFPEIREFCAGHPTLIVGSSWMPDEDIIIEYFNAHPEMRLIIAPHEFNNSRIAGITKKLKRDTTRYSTLKPGEPISTDSLIIDCFGILSSCYRYASIAYIGGGFGAGIHNINEAAVYGIPVVFGPNYRKFKEARDLLYLGGAFAITTPKDFINLMNRFLSEPKFLNKSGAISRNYIEQNIGATKKIFDKIKSKIEV